MRSLLALAFALTACADDPFNALPGAPNTGGLSCSEIVACAADCDSDGCDQACFDDGSAEAQQLIGDIASCIAEHQCETDCSACAPLLDRCVGDDVDPPPTGSTLPAGVVGAWQTVEVTSTGFSSFTYLFNEDGTTSSNTAVQVTGTSGCAQTFSTEYLGIVLLSGDTLDITVTDGTSSTLDCNGQVIASAPFEGPERFRFTTGVDDVGEFLRLDNLDTGNTLTFHR